MATKRLIPYSVHLPEDLYLRMKELAQDRQASALVRDAITMALDGEDAFDAGYKKGVNDCIKIIKKEEILYRIGLVKPLQNSFKELIE